MKKFILIISEEIFPFIFFIFRKHKKMNIINNAILSAKKQKEYNALSQNKLKVRLSDEHDRAIKIDEKTTKFTLGLSVSLTILSAASGTLAKFLPGGKMNSSIMFLCWLASIFMLIASIVSLGALKTLPKFGYGSEHEILLQKEKKSHLIKILLLQEDVNIIRHLRNETAYQCLRNGFIILLSALLLLIAFIK